MKKIMLTAFIVFTSIISNAQLTKKQWIIGGEINFLIRKDDMTRYTAYNLTPTIGYFILDKFAVGMRTDFSKNSLALAVLSSSNLSSNSIGPFARYYILSTSQRVNIFADAAYLYTWVKYDPNLISTLRSNGFNIKAGPVFFINPSIALEFTIGYFHAKEIGHPYEISDIRTGLGLKIHLGS